MKGDDFTGKTSSAVKDRYNAKAYDQMPIRVPKGRKATVEQYAQEHDISVNGLVNELLANAIGIAPDEWKITSDSD